MPILALILTILLTGGCAVVERPSPGTTATETALFARGMAELGKGGKTPSFDELRKGYPESPWNDRARTVLDLTRTQRDQALRLTALEQDNKRCLRDNDQLRQENSQLRADQEKLKNLMIGIERRTK